MLRNKSAEKPLYLKLADDLRAGILNKHWQPGDLLPSEPQLCREYGVSRGTAVKAIELLAREGLAQRRQGLGTFVVHPSLHRQPGVLLSFSASVREQGGIPGQRILEKKHLKRAEALQFGCSESAIKLVRLRSMDEAPCAIHRTIIPDSITQQIPELAQDAPNDVLYQPQFSLYSAFAAAGFEVVTADELLKAQVATASEARLLETKKGAALMMVHRKSFDASGQLLDLTEALYLGDFYAYEARIVRTTAPPSIG